MLHITKVTHLGNYTVAVTFNDGRSGEANLLPALGKGVFQALTNKALFEQALVDAELGTIVWPNGLDLAPEFVYFTAFTADASLQQQFKAWGYLA